MTKDVQRGRPGNQTQFDQSASTSEVNIKEISAKLSLFLGRIAKDQLENYILWVGWSPGILQT